MITNDNKSFVGYLNKLVNEYNNSFHIYSGKNSVDANYSSLTEKNESGHKASKFNVGDWVKITIYKNIFRKSYIKNWLGEIFVIDSVLKIIHGHIKSTI